MFRAGGSQSTLELQKIKLLNVDTTTSLPKGSFQLADNAAGGLGVILPPQIKSQEFLLFYIVSKSGFFFNKRKWRSSP